MELEFRNLKLEELDKPAEFLASLILSSLGQNFHPIVLLTGSMGVGKTTFASRVVKKISPKTNVNSPTYTLINKYSIPFGKNRGFSVQNFSLNNESNLEELNFYHFDLHRLKSPDELEDLGFEEIWGRAGISIIEWWQIAKGDLETLPLKIEVQFKTVSENERDIVFKSFDVETFPMLKKLWKELEKNPT
ncbi:tRNA (adenosine(37)-N6)-threonylcarbamoyltransferase complex ATPase subunit type 1 TsaE [Leptospira alexanderi]|uniref:tRNA (adenosine(37)-N6)-threonylcarbamoyltransferase complex ATPase subunit type 1 TsaE n=1 Tax=Leptospira alexanderi TaxID=100053 RepID=UPI0009911BFE|nr:tRNA (adenosine(37)-N6)-threonylcarbamoyltransferase complex ATPase subunit type 1 TsaE [Leptospira alexanderi]